MLLEGRLACYLDDSQKSGWEYMLYTVLQYACVVLHKAEQSRVCSEMSISTRFDK